MNKASEEQQQHTKEKLKIFELYLRYYLSVLTNSHQLGGDAKIHVIDCFAGEGINKHGEAGSPVIAAEVIKEVRDNLKGKTEIRLFVNEIDEEKFDRLQQSLKDYESFTEWSNQDADIFLKNWAQRRPMEGMGTYTFLFIDPYGYTDITDFKSLFTQARCDYLVFIPISHVYRFLGSKKGNPPPKCVLDFLERLGIDESVAKRCSTLEKFAEEIKDAFIRISGKEFCCYHTLKVKGANSTHALFFLSGHPLGAEKYLEALEELRKIAGKQMELEFPEKIEDIITIEKIFKREQKKLSNVDLYTMGLQESLLAKQVNSALKNLRNSGKILTFDSDGKTEINSPYFYIGMQYYKKKEIKIYVQYVEGLPFSKNESKPE